MARFIAFLFVVAALAGLLLFGWKNRRPGPQSPVPASKEQNKVRIGVVGRPADLPVRALRRLPAIGKTELDIRVIEDPGLRWRLLAAGELDLVLCTLDDFALAVPRHDPGVLLFPSARSVGSDAVVTRLSEGATSMRVAYVDGSAGQYLVANLLSRHPDWKLTPVPAVSAEQARDWYARDSVQAIALWEPWVGRWEEKKARVLLQTSAREPITEVWVASRQALRGERAPRVQRQDLQNVCQAWFLMMAELRRSPGLAMRAIAEENETTVEELTATLRGLDFLTLQESQTFPPEQLITELEQLGREWALSGAPNSQQATYAGVVDFALCDELDVPPVVVPAETPTPMQSPTPSATPTAVIPVPATPSPLAPSVTPAPLVTPTPAVPEELGPFAPPTPAR